MGNINVSITHNGTGITSYVLGYKRESKICNGVGTLMIQVDRTVPRTFAIGDVFVLREEGHKIGEYYPNRIKESPKGEIVLECQDYSKYMQDYFVARRYKSNYGSSRYWIERILNLAGISYNFTTTSYGYVLPENGSVGFDTAYGIVMRLCQQSGWYFYFDGNGVCQIGKLENSYSNPTYTLKNSNYIIISQQLVSDDDNLRNQVNVWGGSAPGSTTPFEVFTTLTTSTPWDRDAGDKRAIVYANNYLTDLGTARSLGKKLLDEYSQTLSVKIYEIAGYASVDPGDIGYFRTDIFRGLGRITTIESSVSSNSGFRTKLIVDERCPRIFGYWSTTDEYVYIGTNGDGVWRKPFGSSTWSNYSTGLTNLYINDLKIKNGLFACTSTDYRAFRREIIESSWEELEPTGFFDEDDTEYSLTDLVCSGCGINERTGEIYVGYSDNINNKSWLVTFYPDDTYIVEFVSTLNTETEYTIKDVDTNNSVKILTVEGGRRIEFDCDKVVRYSGRYGNPSVAMSGVGNQTSLEHITITPTTKAQNTSIVGGAIVPFPAFDGVSDNLYSIFTVGNTKYSSKFSLVTGIASLKAMTSSANETPVAHGFLEPNKSITAFWDAVNDEVDVHKTDFDLSTDTTILSVGTTNQGLPLDGGAVYKDGSGNLKFAFIYGEYDAGGNYVDKVHVSIVDVFTSTVNTTSHTITPPTNTTLPLMYNYTETFISSDNYLKTMLSPNAESADGVNPYYGFSIVISIAKSSNAVSFGEITGAQRTPPGSTDVTSYCGVFNPVSNTFYFDITDLENNSKAGYYAIGEASTTGTYTAISEDSSISGFGNNFAYAIFTTKGAHLVTSYTNNVYSVGAQTGNSYSGYGLPTGGIPVGSFDDVTNSIYIVSATGDVINTRTSRTIGTLLFSPAANFHAFIIDKLLITADNSYVQVLKQADNDPGVTSAPYIIRRGGTVPSGHLFSKLKLTEYPLNLEVSRETPAIAFGGDISGDLPEMYLADVITSGQIYLIATTTTPYPSPMGYYSDSRSADFANYLPDILTSGWEVSGDTSKRYVLTTRKIDGGLGGIYYRDATDYFSNWTRAWRFPENTHRLETTNYLSDVPYVFVSTSGSPSKFYQLNPEASSKFQRMETNIPSSNILVIRADDRI